MMKCLLYIPPVQCEGTQSANVAEIRVGGLTMYQRACRCIQRAKFDEILVVKPETLETKDDERVKIPVTTISYAQRVCEKTQEIRDNMSCETDLVCVCILKGMVSPECFEMRPKGADVQIKAQGEMTGIYFMSPTTFEKALSLEYTIDQLDSEINETFEAPEKAIYHRLLSRDDIKAAQNLLTRSLRKPIGRDADGLIAYSINRPCSLFVSKRIANSFITPNMVTAFGLVVGLAGAALMFSGKPAFMVIGVILWQLSSMIDGIDGELARMRLSPSHSGEWFDTIADDITNISFLVGLGHALSVVYDEPLYFYAACSIAGLMVIEVLWFYREFVKMGIASHNHFEWGFESENKANKVEEKRGIIRIVIDKIAGGFAWIAKRDFYTFLLMVLVIIGFYKPAYYIMTAGAACVGVGGIVALSLRAVRGLMKR